MYERLFRKADEAPDLRHYSLRLALSFGRMNRFEEALAWYKRAYKEDPGNRSLLFQLARAHMQVEDYPKAQELLEQYKREVPGDGRTASLIEICKDATTLEEEGSSYRIRALDNLNSNYNEYAPYIIENGLYFSSDRSESTGDAVFPWLGTYYSDIFIARRKDASFENPEPMEGNINTNLNEGVGSFNKDGNVFAFTRCHGTGFDSSCAIIIIRRERGKWGEQEVISFTGNDEYMYGQPSLSPDGNTLVFSSNRPGGQGGHDLWYSQYKNNRWSSPENFGPRINSRGDEMFPNLHDDNTLYFASNGHAGFGGLDIFRAVKLKDMWRKPDNLMPPVNSGGDDFSYVLDPTVKSASSGVFSSNRAGSKGDDLFAFSIVSPPLCNVCGTVYDKKTNKPLPNSTVFLTDVNEGKTVFIKTDENGKYCMKLAYDKIYTMDAYKKYYANNEEKPRIRTIGLNRQKYFTQDFFLSKWTIEEIRLEGIYYDLNSADIRDDAKPILDSLARILKIHDYLVIELASHTDCRADSAYNMKLSEARAKSCVDYLIAQGIIENRLDPKGYGEEKLLNNCACEGEEGPGLDCDEEQHQLNRRTTFRILRTDFQTEDDEEFGQPYVDPEGE